MANRLGKAGRLLIAHFESVLGGEVADHPGEHLAIGAVGLLKTRFELGVSIKNLAVGSVAVLSQQQRSEVPQNARLPIDQRSVTIERNVFELRKIQHDCKEEAPTLSLLLRVSACAKRTSSGAHPAEKPPPASRRPGNRS